MTPLFKKGLASKTENYRPISILCCGFKVLESCVKKDLLIFLFENNLIHPSQHGFLSLHSTTTNLLQACNSWSHSFDLRYLTRIIYIDFKKAFDSVSHTKLLFKLKFFGFSDKMLSFARSLICNRTQRVLVGDMLSDSLPLLSGVAQGSILGPIWFILFINDLPQVLPSSISNKGFADDLKIYSSIKNDNDMIDLQIALDLVAAWSHDWQLDISIEKSFSLDIGNSSQLHSYAENEINGSVISPSFLIKDLGVSYDNSLSFSSHIHDIVAHAKIIVFRLFRSFITRNTYALRKAFITYVRPSLEYCSPIWNPHFICDITSLESVQKIFTKKLLFPLTYPYLVRLSILNLDTLEKRRLYLDLTFCFKILTGRVSGSPSDYGITLATSTTRGNSLKIYIPPSRIDVRKFYFSVRIAKIWNSLEDDIICSPSIASFKHKLKSVNFDRFLVFK